MPIRDANEEFEFLLNFLASDGVDPDPDPPRGAAASSQRGDDGDRSFRIQRGSDGKLDLGQVRAFYEKKNKRAGKGVGKEMGRGALGMAQGDPGLTDHSRIHSGLSVFLNPELALYCTLLRTFAAPFHPMTCGVHKVFGYQTLTCAYRL